MTQFFLVVARRTCAPWLNSNGKNGFYHSALLDVGNVVGPSDLNSDRGCNTWNIVSCVWMVPTVFTWRTPSSCLDRSAAQPGFISSSSFLFLFSTSLLLSLYLLSSRERRRERRQVFHFCLQTTDSVSRSSTGPLWSPRHFYLSVLIVCFPAC